MQAALVTRNSYHVPLIPSTPSRVAQNRCIPAGLRYDSHTGSAELHPPGTTDALAIAGAVLSDVPVAAVLSSCAFAKKMKGHDHEKPKPETVSMDTLAHSFTRLLIPHPVRPLCSCSVRWTGGQGIVLRTSRYSRARCRTGRSDALPRPQGPQRASSRPSRHGRRIHWP